MIYISDRQKEAWLLQVSGLQHKEIATRLGITRKTVEHLLHSVYAKLGIHALAESIHIAYSIGLVAPMAQHRDIRFGRQPRSANLVIVLPTVRRDRVA